MRTWIITLAAAALVGGGYLALSSPHREASIRQFDPDRLASLELRLWQAYYAKQNARLFGLLVRMLREQYHYSWATATVEGFHLARAAATFGNLRGDYESVLPDLESAYATARRALRADFDSRTVAQAELAWWVARRVPGANGADHVGALIADEYALLYDVPRGTVASAGMLRAEAAALRDQEEAHPDWETIGKLLTASYRALAAALQTDLARVR